MFGRGRKNGSSGVPPVGAGPADEGMSRPPGAARKDEKTIIGGHITVEGRLLGRQDLVVEGAVRGMIDIRPYDLEVGPRGRVEAEIRAQNVSIRGQFKGRIDALEKVAIARQAEFFGNIKTRRLAVEDGAGFKGMIELAAPPATKKED
jgi:cytoskeletal protein CcmA (bactofilin family)